MVLYFSATGNCKYVAERIASATDDEAVDIEKCLERGENTFDLASRSLGIVSPTYFYNLPEIVENFLRKVTIKNLDYTYAVAAYYSASGGVTQQISKIIKLDAEYSVRMPDTWTPMFDLSDKNHVKTINFKAEEEIEGIIEKIRNKEKGIFVARRFPSLICGIAKKYYELQRKTKNFHADEICVGCGLCAANCPYETIELENGKPSWKKDKCLVCLRCLHSCPEFAIQYGRNTRKHGQYRNPNV